MGYLDLLRQRLPLDEGVKKKLYLDTRGKWTIGVGRNLTDVGIRDDEQGLMLDNDIRDAEQRARYFLPDFDTLSDVRKFVVCNMSFQLADKLANFSKFLLAVHEQRWLDAATEMLDSHWAREDSPSRARYLAEAMRTDSV
jgi:lysozyme